MFSVLVKSYSISPVCLQHTMQKALFLRFFVSIDQLFDNLECAKRNYHFEEKSRKSL